MPYLYATLGEIKERLCLDGNDRDGALSAVLNAASRWVDRSTGHRFYASSDIDPEEPTEVRYYAWAPGTDPMALPVDDLLSVAEIATDANGDRVYEYTWASPTDYWLGPRNAPADGQPYTFIHRDSYTGRYWFPAYDGAVRITGSWGYCTLANRPEPIRELTLLVAEQMARPLLDMVLPGVSNYSIGSDLRVNLTENALPTAAKVLVDMYRKPLFLV